ncbi:MAG: hypothetical protein EOR72_23410 [Mesorhizobium sp.]|nr:MAG: hypothetical protein EOR72_23410 [Mesorhizobium sp.]
MTRHTLLRTVDPAWSAAARGVVAANSNGGPIMAGFRRWEALRDSISFDVSDNDLKRIYDDMSGIVEAMLAIPAATIQEFAAQYMVVCSGDEIEHRKAACTLHAHAQAIVATAPGIE